jgi:hypothetical protein
METGWEGNVRAAKDTASQQSESSRKHRQIKKLERFAGAAAGNLGRSARNRGQCARPRLQTQVNVPFDTCNFAGRPLCSRRPRSGRQPPRRRSGRARIVRRTAHAVVAGVHAVQPSMPSRTAARQPAFIDCL